MCLRFALFCRVTFRSNYTRLSNSSATQITPVLSANLTLGLLHVCSSSARNRGAQSSFHKGSIPARSASLTLPWLSFKMGISGPATLQSEDCLGRRFPLVSRCPGYKNYRSRSKVTSAFRGIPHWNAASAVSPAPPPLVMLLGVLAKQPLFLLHESLVTRVVVQIVQVRSLAHH